MPQPTQPGQEFEIFAPYEAFYIEGMLFCTESALNYADYVSAAIQAGPGSGYEATDALHHLRNIVLQAAALSRYFWPTSKKKAEAARYAARGALLRKALSVADESPLNFKPPHPRNQMEHFDEYLDDYLQRGVVGQIIPYYFGPAFDSQGVPQHFFQAYFTDTGVFEILGERYPVQPIVEELARIHGLLVAASQSGGRLPK